jgi:hypothetical protein
LSNTNEKATVLILQNILELNKEMEMEMEMEKAGPCMHDVTAWNLTAQDPNGWSYTHMYR